MDAYHEPLPQSMNPGLTVAICTHDPRKDYLDRTLASLKEQDLDRRQWELLVIDNASSNGVCATVDVSWHPLARMIREERIGLTMARLRAITESSSGLILFVDDDNVLEADYLRRMVALSQGFPFLGVIGSGRIEPEFEEQPQPALKPYLPMLALRTVPTARWSNDPHDQFVPWGAGMAVRREVADRYRALILADPMKQRLDRAGNALNSCGDDEFSWVACEMGMGKGIFPELGVKHLIGRPRVQLGYMLRLAEGHAFSHALLGHLHGVKKNTGMPPPAIGRFISRLIRLRISEARWEFRRLWNSRKRGDPLHSAFNRAQRDGLRRFRATIPM